MTAWDAVYRVKINNTAVTSATLSGLTITSGRTDIYSQPVAGYCNLTLLETNTAVIPYDINDSISIEVKDSSGTYIPIFGGFLTDLSIDVTSSGSTAMAQKIKIYAVGALARLGRTVYTGTVDHQFDGDRIYTLLSLVLFNSWNEVPAATTWATYDASITWANAENSGLGEIDRPGDYELHSQTGLNNNIYQLCAGYATSGLGYLYEDAQGRIGYADSTHRSQYLSTYGYVDLDANQAIGPGLTITKRAGEVRNSVTVAYDADSASTVIDSDAASIAIYGELASNITTTLRHQSDAEAQAAFYLLIRAYPQFAFRNMTFELGNSELDNSDRDSLLNVFMGMPVNITNLPANMVDGSFQGFVEGWTWTASLNRLQLTLTVSPVAYSLQAFQWDDVSITEYWNTINPTLDWLNATIVA